MYGLFQAQALYAFEGDTTNGELSFGDGETLTILQQVCAHFILSLLIIDLISNYKCMIDEFFFTDHAISYSVKGHKS